MSSDSRRRAQLRSDFRQRARYDPEGVLRVPERGWEYICVHPMADEIELLAELGMRPEDCSKVDCYWATRGDVVFLQIVSTDVPERAPGLYARRSEYPPHRLYLWAVVEQPYITRSTVEAVMDRFSRLGGLRLEPRSLGTRLRRLTG